MAEAMTAEVVEQIPTEDVSTLSDEDLTKGLSEPPESPETPPVEEKPPEEPPKVEEPTPPAPPAVSKEDYDRLLKKVEAQEQFIARQATEVGLLRKATPEQEEAELQRIRDLYLADPIEGRKAHDAYLARQKEIEAIEQRRQMEEAERTTRESVTALVPDIETSIPEMVALLKEDKVDSSVVDQFSRQPYLFGGNTLWNLHRRVVLGKENQTLKSQVESLTAKVKELEEKPTKLVQGIERALKSSPPLNGKSGQAVKDTTIVIDKDLSEWSDAELEAGIKAGSSG